MGACTARPGDSSCTSSQAHTFEIILPRGGLSVKSGVLHPSPLALHVDTSPNRESFTRGEHRSPISGCSLHIPLDVLPLVELSRPSPRYLAPYMSYQRSGHWERIWLAMPLGFRVRIMLDFGYRSSEIPERVCKWKGLTNSVIAAPAVLLKKSCSEVVEATHPATHRGHTRPRTIRGSGIIRIAAMTS